MRDIQQFKRLRNIVNNFSLEISDNNLLFYLKSNIIQISKLDKITSYVILMQLYIYI